jgi:hypothetical protein
MVAIHARVDREVAMGLWLAIALIIGAVVMLGFRALAKRSLLKQRTPSALEDLHAPVKDRVSFEVFREVWTTLGKAYGIDPRLIHPNDTFAELSKADSWVLGKGEDDLTEWLDRKALGRPAQLQTVLDLATWLQRSTVVSTTG